MSEADNRKVFMILGITGNQGGSVARTFLDDAELRSQYRLRGLTRDTSSPASKSLAAEGIEMVAGDLHSPSTLNSAFAGANVIFSVTDFWQPYLDPANAERAKKEGKSIGQLAYELEYEQGRHIADAAAALGDGLQRFIVSMLSSPKKWSNGKYTELWHYESKADMISYINSSHPSLAAKMSQLNMGVFYVSWKFVPAIGPQQQSDGSHVMRLPCKPDTPVPQVHPNLDTGLFVRALLEKLPPGVQLYGETCMLSWKAYVELWGKVKGKTARYEECSVEDYDKLMPGGFGREIAEMFEWMGDFGYVGGDPECKRVEELGVDIPGLSDAETYIKSDDWALMGA